MAIVKSALNYTCLCLILAMFHLKGANEKSTSKCVFMATPQSRAEVNLFDKKICHQLADLCHLSMLLNYPFLPDLPTFAINIKTEYPNL